MRNIHLRFGMPPLQNTQMEPSHLHDTRRRETGERASASPTLMKRGSGRGQAIPARPSSSSEGYGEPQWLESDGAGAAAATEQAAARGHGREC